MDDRDPATLPAATRLAFEAARELGMQTEVLDPEYGYLFEIRAGAKRRVFLGGRSPLNDAIAARLAQDKHYTSLLLARAGLGVPETARCLAPHHPGYREGAGLEPGLRLAETLGGTAVVKPNRLSHGRGVSFVRDAAELVEAIHEVWELDSLALVQSYEEGTDIRLDFLDGTFLAGYERREIVIEGDGERTVEVLMESIDPRMGEPSARRRLMVALAPALESRGWSTETVVPAGQTLSLASPIRNLNLGSTPVVIDTPAPHLLETCLAAGKALGLRHFGVDLRDAAGRVSIIEVNASPLLTQLFLGGHRERAIAAQTRVLAAAMR